MNELSASVMDVLGGRVSVRDSGGDGPVVVFVHGALVDGRLWDGVWPAVAQAGYRCVVPDLPLGAHRIALDPDADRSRWGRRGESRVSSGLLARNEQLSWATTLEARSARSSRPMIPTWSTASCSARPTP